jgi:hypothetical protein
MKTLATNATIIDQDGFIQESNVLVTQDDHIITIGDTDHMVTALIISDDRIVSSNGWEVIF